MPKYFFQVSGATLPKDHDGHDLPDASAARAQAVASMGELLRDLGGTLPEGAAIRTRVFDEAGQLVVTLQFNASE